MPEQTLLNYIKQNLAAGFTTEQIRQALWQAGWQEAEIEEGFFAIESLPQEERFFERHGKKIVVVLIILIALPILAVGGRWLYLNFVKPENPPRPETRGLQKQDSQEIQETAAAAQNRDRIRLADIQNLQRALDKYFVAHKFYPKTLTELVTSRVLSQIPADPKTRKSYLYAAFGDPPLYYSLSYLLETDVGTLKAGLGVVSSDISLSSEIILKQQDLIQGITGFSGTNDLILTDLAKSSFYPREEVTLDVNAAGHFELESAKLVMSGLDLLDSTSPFRFQFTAPAEPGHYGLRVFGFDKEGVGHFATTTLTVREP